MGLSVELFLSVPSLNLCCVVCHQVLESPIQSDLCRHVFCRSCVFSSFESNENNQNQLLNQCPLDNSQLQANQLHTFDDQQALLQLDRLQLKCPNEGCSQIGSYLQIRVHRYECKHQVLIDVPNECARLKQQSELNSKELHDLQYTIVRLQKQFEIESVRTEVIVQNRLIKCKQTSDRLNQRLLRLQQQLSTVLFSNLNEPSIDLNGKHSEQSSTCISNQMAVVFIRNLDQFMTSNVLCEYLRQNDIRVISCELQVTLFERSRDYRIECWTQDLKKLLDSNLWPVGVCVHLQSINCSQRSPLKTLTSTDPSINSIIIYGQRSTPPVILIKSGFIY